MSVADLRRDSLYAWSGRGHGFRTRRYLLRGLGGGRVGRVDVGGAGPKPQGGRHRDRTRIGGGQRRADRGLDRRRIEACRGLVSLGLAGRPGADGDRDSWLCGRSAGIPRSSRGAGEAGLERRSDRPARPRAERGGAHVVRRPRVGRSPCLDRCGGEPGRAGHDAGSLGPIDGSGRRTPRGCRGSTGSDRGTGARGALSRPGSGDRGDDPPVSAPRTAPARLAHCAAG